MRVQVGERLDSMGVKISLEDADLMTDAIVIAKVVDADGRLRLALSWTEGMSWIERLGMLRAAEIMEHPPEDDMSDDD